MKVITGHCNLLPHIAKSHGKWCMYIGFDSSCGLEEVLKAAPYLNQNDVCLVQIFVDGFCFFVFDSESECDEYYHQTVGDDGPTDSNSYNGPCHVYALTCDPYGNLAKENT